MAFGLHGHCVWAAWSLVSHGHNMMGCCSATQHVAFCTRSLSVETARCVHRCKLIFDLSVDMLEAQSVCGTPSCGVC